MISLGLASAVGMSMCSFLMTRFSIKIILMASIVLTAMGAYYFSLLSLTAARDNFMIGNALFGFGLGLFMVPLTTYSLATIKEKYIAEAAGLYTYGRMLGTSVGVSLISTVVARESQTNWMQLNAHINPFNPHLQQWLAQQHLTLLSSQALGELKMLLLSQSSMLAFVDAYRLIAISLLLFMPLIVMMRAVTLKNN